MTHLLDLRIANHPSGARLEVRVKPRASRSRILEPRDGQLVVALAAPPVDGEANAELIRLLASATGLPKTHVTLATGAKSRTKHLLFAGLDATELRARLDAAATPSGRK